MAHAQKTQTPRWVSGESLSFLKANLASGFQLCNILQIGWCWGNRVVFQESQSSPFWFWPVWGPHAYAQPEVTILHLGGGLSLCRRTQKYASDFMYIPRGGSRNLAPSLQYCVLTAFPLFLHSLIPLISNYLNLLFGTGGKFRRLKSFSYKQEAGDMERLLYWGGLHRVLLSFTLGSNTILIYPQEWQPRILFFFF